MKNNVEKSEIKRFVIVLVVLVVIIAGIYLITSIFVTKDNVETPEETTPGTINYNVAIVGNMLVKPENEYYVYLYDSESKNESIYEISNIIIDYLSQTEEDLEKIYDVDLAKEMNKAYKVAEGEEPNTKATTVEDFQFGDFTLLRIKNGKVVEYIDTVEDIEKELK